MLALVWLRANERERAVEIFREVLEEAAAVGIYQSILDQGPEIGDATAGGSRQTPATPRRRRDLLAYIDRLLDGWRALYQPDSQPQRDAERESLSAREREIVELIAQGQSNKEIARTLGIAPETVKSHVKSIFVEAGGRQTRACCFARAGAGTGAHG